jgi:hypothetical protein
MDKKEKEALLMLIEIVRQIAYEQATRERSGHEIGKQWLDVLNTINDLLQKENKL